MHTRAEKYFSYPTQMLESSTCQDVYCGIILATLFSIISLGGILLINIFVLELNCKQNSWKPILYIQVVLSNNDCIIYQWKMWHSLRRKETATFLTTIIEHCDDTNRFSLEFLVEPFDTDLIGEKWAYFKSLFTCGRRSLHWRRRKK